MKVHDPQSKLDEELHLIKVPYPTFERFMTCCMNQNNCLDTPKDCKCAKEVGINLEEQLYGKQDDRGGSSNAVEQNNTS